MFKFVDGSAPPQKRHQSQRACEPCRKRKKRCHHAITTQPRQGSNHSPHGDKPPVFQSSSPSPGTSDRPHESPIDVRTSPNSQAVPETANTPNGHDARRSPSTSHLSENDKSGRRREDMTTELGQVQVDARQTLRHNAQDPGPLNSRFIGDLNPEGVFLAATSPDTTRGNSVNDSVGVWLNTALNRRASQADRLQSSAKSSSSIFYGSTTLVQRVLIPMLEEECLSTIPSLARSEALSNIYFERIHPIFPVLNDNAYRGLDQSDPARILLQQGICLAASKNPSAIHHLVLAESTEPLSCREFGDRLSGAMRLSIEMGFVTDRIVLIQALALMSQFIDSPDGGDLSSQLCSRAIHYVQSIGLHIKTQQDDESGQYGRTLLSCIWAIDRTNAAFNGRPVLIHERDLRRDFEQCFEQQDPCFRLFLQVIVLLDKVIGLYRPSTGTSDPILDDNFPSFEEVVVRCGATNIGTSSLDSATIETLYHAVAILSCRSKSWRDPERSSISYLRQSLSTESLTSSAGSEFHDQLVPFPFVPYAMALSLSIIYREMRHSKVSLHRLRARARFQRICDALSELEGVFWRASTTAEMGRKMLKEMDRAFSTVTASENRKQPPEIYPNSTNSGNDSSSNIPVQNHNDQIEAISHDEQTPMNVIQGFDSSLDFMGDVDLFGMFDPAFDLDGFDSCLEGSVNPSYPTQFQ